MTKTNSKNGKPDLSFLDDPALTMLTSGQVADLLNVGINMVNKYIRRGHLEARKLGGRWFIDRGSAVAFSKRTRKVGRPIKTDFSE